MTKRNNFLTLFPKKFWITFLGFIIINLLLYLFIYFCNNRVPFDKFDYTVNAHHFLKDQRIEKGGFNFLRALGQYDAQWYLKTGKEGYPKSPANTNINDKNILNGLSYAFFPLYPIILRVANNIFNNIELSGFVLINILLVANFFSLYFVISKLYNQNCALKTVFLLFLYPFSIFFRSYFSDGLLLLLLIWFGYFLIKKKWFFVAIFLGFLTITRGTGLFMIPIFLYQLAKELKIHLITVKKTIFLVFLSTIPFLLWIIYCYIQTGNRLYFYLVRAAWTTIPIPIIHNLAMIMSLATLPLHDFHLSKIDVFSIVIVLVLLIKSKKSLHPQLWIMSFLLWLGPLLVTDTMSFSRYQIVSFPLFVYLSQKIHGAWYMILLTIFGIGLYILSLYFVNWYWVG